MKTSLETKSKIDGVITVELEEADYLDDLNKVFNTIRNQYNRPGFRNGKVPYSLIYNLYGYKTLCDCCVEKALGAVRDFINQDENLKNLTMMQPLVKALKFPNKNEVNYRHPGNISFSYIYAAVPNINIDDIETRFKNVKIDQKVVGEITNEDVDAVIERFKKKIIKYANINKVVDPSNVVFVKNPEQKFSDENFFFPAQGATIDGKPIDLMDLSVGSEFELDVNDVLSLSIPSSFASYFEECIILARLRQGKQKLIVTSIRAFEKKNVDDKELLEQFKEDYRGSATNFKNVDEYKESVNESLRLYMDCLFNRIVRTSLRENLINLYGDEIVISEEYLKHCGFSTLENNLYKQFLLNNIKWGCIREALLKKFEITLTEQDLVDMTEAYELSHNSDIKSLEKCIDYGSFLGIADNVNKNDFVLDCKLTEKLLSLCNVNTEIVSFVEFAKFLKVKILENFEKYKSYEVKK